MAKLVPMLGSPSRSDTRYPATKPSLHSVVMRWAFAIRVYSINFSIIVICFNLVEYSQVDIVCGLESGLIIVFDRKAFSLVKRLDFHRKTVSALAVNSEIIISGSQARQTSKFN